MSFIEELRKKRLKYIEGLRANEGFEEGTRNLLSELYPDNAHFVYELLQNAEDAEASSVKFILSNDGLKVIHDGKKQFTENDVESITGIAVSKKKDDFNKIGKFGVGFKSVFSYTNNPKIYSKDFTFEIHDLVCPNEIDFPADFKSENIDSTIFYFPFNHVDKPKEAAVEEICKVLVNLADTTILFLGNIQKVSWKINLQETVINGFIKRLQTKQNIVTIESPNRKSNWLFYRKEVPQKKHLYVCIAFRLTDDEDYKIDKKVVRGGVAIFFPAEKEVSNLKFYLHAPFSATVARDSIQNREENNYLRDLLVDLFAQSLSKIKELGLLDSNFLSILPNKDDELTEFYAPFRERIVSEFQSNNLTPTWNGEFKPSTDLFQTKNSIKKIINSESILKSVIKKKTQRGFDWAISAERGSRTYKFLETLEIDEFDTEDLLKLIINTFSSNEKAHLILSTLSDQWLQDFYSLLDEGVQKHPDYVRQRNSWDKNTSLLDANIVRLQNGDHVTGKNAYFETSLIREFKDLSIVKSEAYINSNPAKEFLKKLGVEEFDEVKEVEMILKTFYNEDEISVTDNENILHLERFIAFADKHENKYELFKKYTFLKIEDDNGNNCGYSRPTGIYLDKPFQETGLSEVSGAVGMFRLWAGYSEHISDKTAMVRFLENIGVMSALVIREASIRDNPKFVELIRHSGRETEYARRYDYQIENLRKILELNNFKVSLLVWNTVREASRNVMKAGYSPNASASTKEVPSQLMNVLCSYAWIPDRNDRFNKPSDIVREDLPDEFIVDNRNGWLDAIGLLNREVFEENEKNLLEEEQRQERLKIENAALELGISVEAAEAIKEDPTAFDEFLKMKKKRVAPKVGLKSNRESESHNESKRLRYDFDPNRFRDRSRTVTKERSSKVEEYDETKIDARKFLKESYSNDFGSLSCQICQEEMPFQNCKDEWHFVATKIVEKSKEDNIANFLCCCPNCSEMFKVANPNKEDMISILLESDIDRPVLTLELAKNDCDIIFSQQHFEELIAFVHRQCSI